MVALAAVGIYDGALGVAWPSMRDTFDQPLAALGVVLLAYTGGYFLTSSVGGWLLERVGTGRALLGIASASIVGMTLFSISPLWVLVLVGSFVVGTSSGAADLTLNHELAQHHGVRALGFLHAAWGLGAAIGPAVVTIFVTGDRSWRLAFIPVIVIQIGLLAAYVVLRKDWAPVPKHADAAGALEPLDRVALAMALGLFLLYVGVESGVGSWAFTLLTEGRGMSDGTAGAWMSAFWLALTGGRLLLGFTGHRFASDSMLTAGVLASLAAAIALWTDPAGLGEVALVPLGAALAPIFPVLVAVTPERLGAHRAARAIGLQIAASSVGGVALPSALGLAAQEWGVETLGWMISLFAAALAVLHGAALRRRRPPR
jgi:fucose permease